MKKIKGSLIMALASTVTFAGIVRLHDVNQLAVSAQKKPGRFDLTEMNPSNQLLTNSISSLLCVVLFSPNQINRIVRFWNLMMRL